VKPRWRARSNAAAIGSPHEEATRRLSGFKGQAICIHILPAAGGPYRKPVAGPNDVDEGTEMTEASRQWPLWEVFIRSRNGLDHKHCGSVHAPDAKLALQNARDVYTRRLEGVSLWVVRADHIVASDPDAKPEMFDPAEDKIYRHPTFYALPDEVNHM
jgi:ring-1,2-phenylacetyl-CoA epoxidase subunit PaaB